MNEGLAAGDAGLAGPAMLFGRLFERTRAWSERAHSAGWLDEADVQRLAAVEQRTPADLFVESQARPLVVAIFGGTGVGKSSLLNRLAGQPLARTGVERPTSREVTVYVHQSVQLADLPPELPLEAVRIKRHNSAAQRDLLWIDAPDIDSTAEANRRCALAWLPHVDLVCYVVSPERYRDDVGWRVLRERGHKHGWMFVLNRWDEGDPQQVEDFARMLRQAGFADPVLLPTCCLPGRPLASPDQFDRIQHALAELLAAHGLRELTRLGHRARLQELRRALQAAEKHCGSDDVWEKVRQAGRDSWQAAAATIREGAEWGMRTAAARLAADEGGLLGRLKPALLASRSEKPAPGAAGPVGFARGRAPSPAKHSSAGPPSPAPSARLNQLIGQLWDDWTQSKLEACLDATELVARRAGLSPGPVRQRVDAAAKSAGTLVAQQLRDHVRAAFARPGGALARILRRVTGFLMAFLPLLALLWIAWAVVRGFHEAVSRRDEFLGGAFAINSALLVLVAWAVPFTIDRLLRPSLERTALRALRAGLQAGLQDVGQELDQALAQALAEAREYQQQVRELLGGLARLLVKPLDARAPAVARLVADTSVTSTSVEEGENAQRGAAVS